MAETNQKMQPGETEN